MGEEDMSSDLYTKTLNLMIYGAPPSKEVSAKDAWDYFVLKSGDEDWDGHYYKQGSGARVNKFSVTIRRTEYEWIPDEKAITQLKALMASWRKRGLKDFADVVETREDSDADDYEAREVSIYESFGHTKSTHISKTFPLSAARFYKELPYDLNKGIGGLIAAPRSSARLTRLSSSGNVNGF